jgi:hypothetical protein
MPVAIAVVFCYAACASLLGWSYFRHFAVTRPPIGVFTLADIGVMIAGIILVPLLYLALPRWLVGGLLTIGALSVLYFTLEPVVRSRPVVWLISLGLVAADIVTALRWGRMGNLPLVINNGVLVIMAIGITNLWAQSGMEARDAALLGGALTIYDFVATSVLGHMDQLFGQLASLPLMPMVAWPVSDGRYLGLGLGDLLLATMFPMVVRKAYGRVAGQVALAGSLGVLAVLLLSALGGLLEGTFPVMVVLGPSMVFQYAYWRHRHGSERTTWQYLQAEPRGSSWRLTAYL